MFKKFHILSSFVCISVFALTACSNQEAEYKIATLTEENARLARQVHVRGELLENRGTKHGKEFVHLSQDNNAQNHCNK